MITYFLNHRSSLWSLLTIVFAVIAIIYLRRLVSQLRGEPHGKYTYHSLWWPLYVGLLSINGSNYQDFFQKHFIYLFVLWTFTTLCAIIQIKTSKQRTWGQFWRDSMKCIISGLDSLRNFLTWSSKKWDQIHAGTKFLLCLLAMLVIGVCITWFHQLTAIVGAITGLVLFSTALYRCLHSLRNLLAFWTFNSVIMAFAIYFILDDIAPVLTGFSPAPYILICIFITSLWCLSAGIADYDVAQMAGKIINTLTTIALVAVNVFVWWAQNEPGVKDVLSGTDLIYEFNLILLPLVVAGYLAVLFIDIVNYYKKKL